MGCGWSKPAASPENADESESSSSDSDGKGKGKEDKDTDKDPASGESSTSGMSATLENTTPVQHTPPPAEKATIKDDSEKKPTTCSGKSIPDLLAAISDAACELRADAPPPKRRASKEVLDVKASADSQIPPGATARISFVYTNKGAEPLPLDFTIDPDPRVVFELYTPKGARVDKPAGSEPPLPPEVNDAPAPEAHTARVTLAPHGSATLVLPWNAVRYKWASKEKAKGALPGRGYPREPAGPLPRGKYVLKIITPLTDADEGGEHELSQAKVNIEIAGAPQAPATPAVAAPPAVAATAGAAPASAAAPAPAEPMTDDALEQKFLKVTGGGSNAPAPASPAPKKKRKK
ncbi:MAG: hypothetical protein JOZ69_10210 [Myxococcales bacterium]|nr:hypothetical protein [Myxococcales bacterium]